MPVLIRLRHPEITKKFGGVEFVDCYVYDDVSRPALQAEEDQTQGQMGIPNR